MDLNSQWNYTKTKEVYCIVPVYLRKHSVIYILFSSSSAANQPKKEKVVEDDISQLTQIAALPQMLIPILVSPWNSTILLVLCNNPSVQGRYEINFAELHELFAAPPAINLKTYFDIRQNKIHNIRSKVQNEVSMLPSRTH